MSIANKLTYYKVVAIDRLELEIRISNITVALNTIIFRDPNICEVYFKSPLPLDQKPILDQIIENHQPIPILSEPEYLTTVDKRLIVKDNSRPLLTNGYYTSCDDSILNIYDVGGSGNKIRLHHEIGDNPVQPLEHLFNVTYNESYFFTGYIQWKNADFDTLTFEIRPMITPCNPGVNTNFYLLSNGVIIPSNGNGNVSVNPEFVYPVRCVAKTDTGIKAPGYWDADYSISLNKFINLRPNLTGTGNFNLFGKEVVLKRNINEWQFLDRGSFIFETKDPTILGENYRMVYIFKTETEFVIDHEWKAVVNLSMFRKNTI